MKYCICFLVPLCLAVFSSPMSAKDYGKDPRWAKSMEQFAARDAKKAPTEGSLLFVGSSSIRMWDLNGSWPERSTINNGFGGSTIADAVAYFDTLFPRCNPGAIVLYAGDNDINKGLTPEEVTADFEALASKIKARFPGTTVIYIAIKPSTARWNLWPKMKRANDAIESLCDKMEHFHFADIAAPMLEDREGAPSDNWFLDDGLHLSKDGYAKWTKVIKRLLIEAKSE